MEIGDKLTFIPAAFAGERNGMLPGGRKKPLAIVGRVCYIHPKRRFFTVEYNLNGVTMRESFSFKQKT